MTRPPSPAEVLAAYRERTEKQRQYDERQKRQLTLAYEGWGAPSIRRGPDGPIGVWQDDLRPPGLPEHLSDRKSKRVWRKPRVYSFAARYLGGCEGAVKSHDGPHDRHPGNGVQINKVGDDSLDG